MATSSPRFLKSLFNHVALPPCLPGKLESEIDEIDDVLTDRLLNAVQTLATRLPSSHFSTALQGLHRSLKIARRVNAGGKLTKSSLLDAMREFNGEEMIIVYVMEQNSAILLRREAANGPLNIIFEAFEACPDPNPVLACEGALQWSFPGSAVAIPNSVFNNESFQDELAMFLENSSTESIKRFAAHTKKAGSMAFEPRDTVEPALITQMLMSLLEANGNRAFPPLLKKRVRDDVSWDHSGPKPWRRSPFWLVLRVAVHRYLCNNLGGEVGRIYYKFVICVLLFNLLKDCLPVLDLELSFFLKVKVCRRLAKLEAERSAASGHIRNIFDSMFATLGSDFHISADIATETIEQDWETFKERIKRPITKLPKRTDPRHLRLSLPNSGRLLNRILDEHKQNLSAQHPFRPSELPQDSDISVGVPQQIRDFVKRYAKLDELEGELKSAVNSATGDSCDDQYFSLLVDTISRYLEVVGGAYDNNSEQKSIMLLAVMESWIAIDAYAIKTFSLLKDYHPSFSPDMLDVLQLESETDMRRLQKIRTYLRQRAADCTPSSMTIFANPVKGCFAERYYDDSQDSPIMKEIHDRIEIAAEDSRLRKEDEWRHLTVKYEELIQARLNTSCFLTNEYGEHDRKRCTRCYLERRIKRNTIEVFEYPLPANTTQTKVVIFEITCPESFITYRDCTWRILSTLALSNHSRSRAFQTTIHEYQALQLYASSSGGNFSLVSLNKSFKTTHYRAPQLPVGLQDICVPNSLNLEYYDVNLELQASEQMHKFSFAHHCKLTLPKNSPLSSLQMSPNFAGTTNGPSSYETVASKTRCPPGINLHEFLSFQALFSGKVRRWPQVLIELGSSNVNFGTEVTTKLISLLSLQTGPAENDDFLGVIHSIFKDKSFCKRLADQIDQRLDGISANWREVYCMETLITFAIRLFELGELNSMESVKLMSKARTITSKWISALQSDIQTAEDAETSRRCCKYAFWAALLCRRTFYSNFRMKENLDEASLRVFIKCSIAMQDNMVPPPSELTSVWKNAFVRDLKMVWRMKGLLQSSLDANQKSFLSAISSIWPHVQDIKSTKCPRLKFLSHPDDGWIEVTIDPTPSTAQHTIHFHLLEGHLLVMGKPIGKLPPEPTAAGVLQRLFGNQNLRVYPSSLPGMDHVLSMPVYGHEVHVGSRDGSLLVRAYLNGRIMELIPPEIFGSNKYFDLPASLTDDCFHWLDLSTGILEIRQSSQQYHASIWESRQNNWYLDIRKRVATRVTTRGGTARGGHQTLVDPRSESFKLVADSFEHFESPRHLTIFQTGKGKLTAELRRLQLTFRVNNNQLLESRRLRAEIDPDQDAGTWYGLKSKLVLRDTSRREIQDNRHSSQHQRSIIVPMGQVKCTRNGPHVAISVGNNGDYGRFTINEILGRLECPAEPQLLYLKAMYHAYTSFVLPDSLTGRTGTEEALRCLQSGLCQPWTPLSTGPHLSLEPIARLTPRREYYPKGLKVMQTTHWDPNLTVNIQNDGYADVLNTIMEKSTQLSIFSPEEAKPPAFKSIGEAHLVTRSLMRCTAWQRSNSNQDRLSHDVPYLARDRCLNTVARDNVLECAKLIRSWPSRIRSSEDLGGMLQNWEVIGGHIGRFEKVLLTDILHVDLASDWGALVDLCRECGPTNSYHLMFVLASISFNKDVSMEALRTLIAFATLPALKVPIPPQWPKYSNFRHNQIPCVEDILQWMEHSHIPYPGDARSDPTSKLDYCQRDKLQSAEREYLELQQKHAKILADYLLEQWPCQNPNLNEYLTAPFLVNTGTVLGMIQPEWSRLFQNMEFSGYVSHVQRILDQHQLEDGQPSVAFPTGDSIEQDSYPAPICNLRDWPTLLETFLSMRVPESLRYEITSAKPLRAVDLGASQSTLPKQLKAEHSITIPGVLSVGGSSPKNLSPTPVKETQELEAIISTFANSPSLVRQQYSEDLSQSLIALHQYQDSPQQNSEQINSEELSLSISRMKGEVEARLDQFRQLFISHGPQRSYWLRHAGLWPSITAVSLLESLRSTTLCEFGEGMKELLVVYACTITKLQRLLRIQDAQQKSDNHRMMEELENIGHSNWIPFDQPDWILFEIDANMLIRPSQVDVALATISPVSKSNSVLQMNMGQGKTSCIMPMVAAVLADGKNLLRLIVPKSLLLQTSRLLQARLGGLLGREVTHVPFSRRTPTSTATIKTYHQIHQKTQISSGVILALPEHILSFKLSGLQRLSDGLISEAKEMINTQKWLTSHARDVLDECDNILALRTQLIYPSGSQQTVDGHPHRWEVAQSLLARVELYLHTLQTDYPQSIEVIWREQGGFPFVYFLRKDVEDELISQLANDLYDERSPFVPPDCTKSQRLAVKQFVSEVEISSVIEQSIDEILPDKPSFRQTIYLLRGLLVHRILVTALKKRWNVQYGLHPARDPIAVPYIAKGTPSDQAEWGHPDMAIIFTCLAFYYDGLGLQHIQQALEHVLESDDPSQAYDRFSQDANLPDSLREWNSINLEDESQLRELWLHLRRQVVVFGYFLNTFVFPRHAKQFQVKLQASGWDIPLLTVDSKLSSHSQKPKNPTRLTTGFSGTNDGKRMLPLTIHQDDLPSLAHTNAEVLTYLLQPRNRRCFNASYRGNHLSERDLLKMISKEGFEVFIDAGAQILEMDNFTLVKTWLEINPSATAAVYFDEANRPMVLYRQGNKKIPLLASPHAEDLGDCLVYLDEAHTRGTDLKLSRYAKGAFTLGLGQTKDHTVQAAMRLRQLGTTQSLGFFCPPEVYQSILDTCQKTARCPIDASDVIRWLLEQTCVAIEQYQPLYYSQGIEFCREAQAALDNCEFITKKSQRERYLSVVRQIEEQTLKQLYGFNPQTRSPVATSKSSPQIAAFLKELNDIKRGFQDSGVAGLVSALQEVEQEREVAYEVEAVREAQKQMHLDPFKFSGTLHPDIESFAKTGRLEWFSPGFEQAFSALQRTTLGRKHSINLDATYRKLFVSTEFTTTVKAPSDQSLDQFQHPVNWILWSSVCDKAVIVIPEEAELLIPLVKEFASVSGCYLLTYAAPVNRKMLLFNDIQYYTVPSLPSDWTAPLWLRTELGIYSGRLYFDYSECRYLLEYLGLKTVGAPQKVVFTKKPLTFLQEWIAVRRQDQDFSHTPIGFICQGQNLLENHPFFQKVDNDQSRMIQPVTTPSASGASRDNEEDGDTGLDFFDDEPYISDADDSDDEFDDTQLKNAVTEEGDDGGEKWIP